MPFPSPFGRCVGHCLSPPHSFSFPQGVPIDQEEVHEIWAGNREYRLHDVWWEWPIINIKMCYFSLTTLAFRSLSAGVSVQIERSLFSGPDLFLKVRAPKPMCCSSGGSSVIHVSLVSTSGVSCSCKNTHRNKFRQQREKAFIGIKKRTLHPSMWYLFLILLLCLYVYIEKKSKDYIFFLLRD